MRQLSRALELELGNRPQPITFPSPGNEHDVTGLLTEQQIDDLIAFLSALPHAP